jgi:hypothetical protein
VFDHSIYSFTFIMTTFIKSNAAKAVVGLLALAVLAIGSSASAAYTFTQNLKLGSTSSEVVEVQKFLNANGFTVSATGAGSPGMESNYFGAKTVNAVKAFQAAKGISPVLGNWYSLTRATANSMGGSTTLPAGCSSASGYSSTTGAPCSTGSTLVPGCTSTTGYSTTTGLSCAGGSTPSQTGPVTASLSTTNPASGVIVAGQATAKLLDIVFAGSGTVNSVSLKRTGISDQSTLTNVYLYDGVTRLTDGYSFNNNGDLTMNNVNLAVNGSKTISVVADVYASAPSGQTIAVALNTFTSGTTVSSVNVQGNTMSVAAGGTLASVTFPSSQSVTSATVNAGTSSYAIYRQALQVNTRTVWLKAANFRITGSAPANAVANARLFVDGVAVGNVATITMTNGSNYLSFDLSAMPFALTTGSHTAEIRADIVGGSSYNFTVALQQASDLMILDPQVGVNIAVSSFAATAGATITIGAGSATISVDPTFSAMTNVTGGASNAVIAKFKVRGYGEDVKVTSLPVTPVLINACTSGSTYSSAPCNVTTAGATHTQFATGNGLQNVTLYFNGSQVGSQQSWGSGALTFNLGSQLIIPAGVDSVLEVRADLRTSPSSSGAADSTATAGANYTAGTVSANLGAGTAEGFTSHTSYTTSTATGTTLAIQTGLLAVAKNAGYANQTLTPNTAGVKIGSFVVQNQSSSESVRVTGLTVGLTTDGTTVLTTGTTPALTNFSGLRTSETSGSGSTPVQPAASNVFSVDFTLAPGATKVIDIFADSSSGTGNVVATLVVSSLGSSSNISISQNGNGTAVQGQTVTFGSGTVGTPAILTASSTSAQYIAAGSGTATAAQTQASYTLTSTGGSSTVSKIKFTITGTATNPVTSITIGNVTAPVVGGVAWLQGLNLMVPNGGSGLTVNAMITYSTVGTGGVIPNTTSIATLDYVKYSSGGTTSVLTPSVAAPTITLVGSKPTVVVPTTINLGLNLGAENKIGEVTVTADAKGNIKLNEIQFAVASSGFSTMPTFTLARLADGSTTIPGTGCGQGTAAASSQTIFCEFGTAGNTFTTTTATTGVEVNTDFDGYTIAAGTSKTFSLYATVNATATANATNSISTSVVAAGFNWDDASYAAFVADGTAASPANGTNLSGALIYNFPTGSYTIRQ